MRASKLSSFLLVLLAMASVKATRTRISLQNRPQKHGKCEPITIPVCRNIPYTETLFPNLMGNQNQEEAEKEIFMYLTLVKVNCSADIRLFLCSMFAPVCTIMEEPLPPCRDLCESARSGCVQLMIEFGFQWPPAFNCSQFPVRGRPDQLCVGKTAVPHSTDVAKIHTSTAVPGRPLEFDDMLDFVCPSALSAPPDLDYRLAVGQVVAPNCGTPCYKMFFDQTQVNFLRQWVGIWALLALLSCLFTLATFLADMSRFPYPQMAIVHLSLCYCIVALIYAVGLSVDDSVACGQAFLAQNVKPERLIRQGTIQDWRCSVLGMALYFFTMAGGLWWVMLTVAWFLQAGLKWGSEAIDVKASYLHAVVWTVAAVQTVVVLILKKIEGDILSGVCFVGLWDSTSLLYLIIVPLMLYLTVGLLFLILGFASLVRIRTIFKKDGAKTDKLESLMCRIGCFSFFYMLPAVAVVACYVYEYQNIGTWMSTWQEEVCRDPQLSVEWQVPCRYPDDKMPFKETDRPPNWLYMLKYVSIFMVAMFSGTWVWCTKTLTTWRHLYARLCNKASYTQNHDNV